MDLVTIAILLTAGLVGGFLAGLLGIGGGIIFAPTLMFYFAGAGVDDAVFAPLVIGSSLFCTMLASAASAVRHHQAGNVRVGVALGVGAAAAVAVFLMTQFVTTQAWYDRTALQLVLGTLLLFLAVRMLRPKKQTADADPNAPPPKGATVGIGLGTGALSAATGIGGGVILVPGFHHLAHLPLRAAVGTSSAAIVLISLAGVLTNIALGWDAPTPATALGYVDIGKAALLAVPAVFMAVAGAHAASRFDTRVLRWVFATLVIVVSIRMLMQALG